MDPYLSTALGSASASLPEVTTAYSVFPNQGVRMRPYQVLSVRDREGNLLEENRPEPHDAIRADTAFVMTNLLRGVVPAGTAAAAASLEWPLGRQDRHDQRLHRRLVRRLRPGHHDRRLGRPRRQEAARARGNRRAGRPADLDGRDEGLRSRNTPAGTPRRPSRRRATSSSSRSTAPPACPPPPSCPNAITEAFIAGTEPGSGTTAVPRQ